MPVQVAEMTSEVTAIDRDLPLTEAQIEKLLKLLMKRLQEAQQNEKASQETRQLRRESAPPSSIHD